MLITTTVWTSMLMNFVIMIYWANLLLALLLIADVRSLVIKVGDYQIHDVSNALKRFFRSLDAPLLTVELYHYWIRAASLCLDYYFMFCYRFTSVYYFFVEN